ncbi:MAG: nucleotide sugar dehydrogenase, partial [Solirubrobacterales bacterium]
MNIGIIGLGYVGLPLAAEFAEAGHDVVGFDTDARRIEDLHAGRSPVNDVPAERLAQLGRRFEPTGDRERLGECDALLICVPTPLANQREPDLTYILEAAGSLARGLRKGQLVVLESTTYPGTTRERVLPILEESGLAAGRDFHLAYSPERIDPGRTDPPLRGTPKVVGGLTDACRERAVEVYRAIHDDVVEVSTLEAAELTKLLENVFRSVNIALVNELAQLCERMEIDVWEVIDAASTKPYGF